ncbi:MAG: sodium:solute symporter family protein [Prolixibacteraceae bacterium]|nr:sodium:solute symporter family protein [Prolixibacteraceae bacterium]
MLNTIDYFFIAVYFLVILFVGLWTGRKQEKEDYLIANRKLKTLEATSTIFSSRIGAAILLTYTALVYIYGLGAYWYFIGSVFGLFVFYFFGKKVKKLGAEQNFYTLSDFFFYLKGKTAGYLSAVVVVIIMFGWVVLNFTAGAKLVQEYTPISYDISVILIGVIILIYLLAGGFRAVVRTDVIQTGGIFLLFILMIYLLLTTNVKPNLALSELFGIPAKEIVNFFLAGFFIPMASPELWQRIYAIEDQKQFRKSLILSSSFYFIIGFILLMIGMVIRTDIPGLSPDTALIVGFSKLLPVGLAGLSVVIIYSAISSSADTYMFTTASSVTQDFLERLGLLKKEKLPVTMRLILTLLMILGIAMALILRDIVDTTFFFVSLTMSLGFLILVLWIYPKLNKYSVNFSIILCLVGVTIPAIVIGISTSLVIYAIALCIAGLVIGFIYYLIKKAVK